MIVSNAQHETAVVIRRDGSTVVFIRFAPGRLRCERATETAFRAEWHESGAPLAPTLARYFEHIAAHGSTQEALKGLEKLRARDSTVIASLF